MNYTVDLIKSWADRLTYRILKMSGASDTALNNYVKGVVTQNEAIKEADSELRNKLPKANLIFYALVLVAGFIGIRLLLKKKIL